MKHCKCGVELTPETTYKRENRLQSQCKDCFNQYCMTRWTSVKIQTVQNFGGVCKDCGKEFPHYVFDFHHLDPTQKEHSWSKLRLLSESKRSNELSKCVMLCSNCHRIRHYSNGAP